MEDAEGYGYRDGQICVRDFVASLRGDPTPEDLDVFLKGQDDWDEGLINGIGRREVCENLCRVEYTEDSWETTGLPWCAVYNEGAKRGARAEALRYLDSVESA